MPIKLYSYDNCSTCKKAMKFLDSNGLEYQKVDISTCPPTKTELKQMLAAYDGQIKKLFNTSGQLYREMNLSAKLPALSSNAALDLLAQHGKLVKRPFLIHSGKCVAVGFKEDVWKKIIQR